MDINQGNTGDNRFVIIASREEVEVLHSLLAHTCGELPGSDLTWGMYFYLGNALFPESSIQPVRYSFEDSIRLDKCTLNDTTYYQTRENKDY